LRIPEGAAILLYDYVVRDFSIEKLMKHYRLGIEIAKRGVRTILVSNVAIITTKYKERKIRIAVPPNSIVVWNYEVLLDQYSDEIENRRYCVLVEESSWIDGEVIIPYFNSIEPKECFIHRIAYELGLEMRKDWVVNIECFKEPQDMKVHKSVKKLIMLTKYDETKCGKLVHQLPHVINYGVESGDICTEVKIIDNKTLSLSYVVTRLNKTPIVVETPMRDIFLLARPSSDILKHLYINAIIYSVSLPPSSPYIRILERL